MQSCGVHHCVLFLLTLTFTTDPASACVFPIYTKLHQPVTLPCETSCDGVAEWKLDSNRDVVFAQCNKTSCRSLEDGYEMSHTRYLTGDLSLTITKPDYSMRKTYTCECRASDYATVRLRISTVFSAVHVSPGEDLKLDLSVPEPVEVIYRGSVSADGEQICTVTNRSLQCKAEYTPRTSLSYPELTLRGLSSIETGTYTIRNLDYKEEIHVYAVSVSGLTTGETAGIVIAVLLLLLAGLITGVMMYRNKLAADQKRREVKRLKEEVDDLIRQSVSKPPGEEKEKLLQRVEEKIKALDQKYGGDSELSVDIRLFCYKKTCDLVTIAKDEVDRLIQLAIYLPSREIRKKTLRQVEEKIEALEEKYRDSDHATGITVFCKTKEEELMMCLKKKVDDLVHQYKSTPPGEKKKLLLQVEEEIDDLEKKYEDGSRYSNDIKIFCRTMRKRLKLLEQGEFVEFAEQAMTRTEMVEIILVQLECDLTKRFIADKDLEGMNECVGLLLERIKSRCSEQREKTKELINEIKMKPLSDAVTNTEKICKEENDDLAMWCTEMNKELKPAGETDLLLHQD